MWRWIVLALVAANGAFWLWSHGELRAFNLGPIEVAEPARLKAQIHPEALQVTPQEPAPAVAGPAAPEATLATAPAPTAATSPSSAPAPASASASTSPAAPSAPGPLPVKGK